MAEGTKIEGYLRKNRAGMPFAKMSNRRFFTTEGFTVFYYADGSKTKVKGHFDLRNVTGLMPSSDPGVGEGAVDVLIWDANGPQKRMVISFSAVMHETLAVNTAIHIAQRCSRWAAWSRWIYPRVVS